MTPEPRILLFELYHQGHHGQYVRVVLEHWIGHDLPGHLDLVVSQEFAARFPDLIAVAQAHPRIGVHPTDGPVGLQAKTGRRAVFENDLRIGRLLRAAIERHRPDHVLLMYADHVQFSLATGLRFQSPVRISGIYFRPSFYYRAAGRGPRTLRARIDDIQKRILLRFALRNPHVATWFTLDPYAVEPIRRLAPAARIAHLPEAFEVGEGGDDSRDETHRRLGVEDGREVMLLFGSLDPRKGVLTLLDALAALPDALARRACLVMAGEVTGDPVAIGDAVHALRQRGHVQVIHLNGFVADDEMHRLFRAASLVVLPYQHHVGSSGVLIRAAAAGVPVLAPTYGMLGARVEEHAMGLTVDTADPAALAQGLGRFLVSPASYPFDPDAGRALAEANSDDAMASTLFRHVLASV